jgi:hypothetical protein
MQAYRLIDTARTDEAIALLEKNLETQPEDDELRLTLASAYARKAGFRIQTLIPVFLAVKSSADAFQAEEKNRKAVPSGEEESSIRSASTVFLQAKGLAEGFAYLPSIEENVIVYLDHAIHILEEVKKPSQSLALYRGVLRTLKLKFVMARYFARLKAPSPDGATGAAPESKRLDRSFTICGLNTEELDRLFQEIGRLSIEILKDHAIANPDQEIANAAHRQEIESALQQWSVVRRLADQPNSQPTTDVIQRCRQHESLKNLAALFSSLR